MQLQQVFLNLMFNAIEAMPDGGALAVKTSYDAVLNSINIAIADTGQGIEQTMLDQIFEPFFTTKRKGSGLGLAVTRRLVEQHGGDVYVESTPAKGTVFNISLRSAAGTKGKVRMKTKGKVFLLDDEELIVSVLAKSLKREGYEVYPETETDGVIEKIKSWGPGCADDGHQNARSQRDRYPRGNQGQPNRYPGGHADGR